jgi:hypothetical protein
MRQFIQAMVAALFCLMAAACSTTDALTPQAEIPNTDQQAQKQKIDNAQPVYHQQPVTETQNLANTNERAPQNTLEAQARALDSGQKNPEATDPGAATALSANLYKQNQTPTQTNLYTAKSAQTTGQTKGSIRFLPIIGAPLQAVTPLSRELGNSARANGLTIKSSSDQTADHVLKGYLSAFGDGKNITVVYVWDVLDNSGTRLHRIQGQESVPGTAKDAWSAVPAEMMQEIGNATIAEYMKWKQASG